MKKSKNISSFSFQPVSIDKVNDIIKTLNTKKVCPDRDIFFFLTTIWLPHGQLRAIIGGTASLTRC